MIQGDRKIETRVTGEYRGTVKITEHMVVRSVEGGMGVIGDRGVTRDREDRGVKGERGVKETGES